MLEETTCNSIDEKVDKSTETKGLNNKEITQAIRLMNSLKTFCFSEIGRDTSELQSH